MFTKIHGLGCGPSITMLLGNTHGPLREEDEPEPGQETRNINQREASKVFLAELCISFVYNVKSTLDQAKSGLSALGASSPSDVLSLAPGLTLCCLTFSNAKYFTWAHSALLMQKLWISTKQVSYKLPLLPTSLGGQWDKSSVSGPALPHGI